METKFQTSFIPKKPTLPPVGMRTPVSHAGDGFASVYLMVSVLALVISLASVGYMYWHKNKLVADQALQQTLLDKNQKEFDNDHGPALSQIQVLNTKITLAQGLLANHLALSGVFARIGRVTIHSVRFMSLDLSAPKTPGDSIKISLQGYGLNLPSVAFQSDVLNALSTYHLTNVVSNPALTSPSTDSKGKVSFGFSASMDPTGRDGAGSLYYKDFVKATMPATMDASMQAPDASSQAPSPDASSPAPASSAPSGSATQSSSRASSNPASSAAPSSPFGL